MFVKPYVVGFAGGTCSGKTTLVKSLAEKFSAYSPIAVHMDSYYKKTKPTVIAPITRIEYIEANHPSALELDRMYVDLDDMLGGQAGEGCRLLLIEGLFALCLDEVREKLDLKVYIDLQSDERLYRRIKRWSARTSIEDVAERYLDTVRFRHDEFVEPSRWHADMVINGDMKSKGVEILCHYIETSIETSYR